MGPIALSLLVYLLIFLVSSYVFGYRIPFWGAILLYLICYLVVSSIQQIRGVKEIPRTRKDPPGSGPIGRAGPVASSLVFLLTAMLSALNPFQFAQQMQQIAGQFITLWRLRGRLPSPETYVQEARYNLPFEGEWLVINGGTSRRNSHSWEIITQRYAYDFVIARDEGRRHTGKGTRLDEYFCYDAPILAAADGEVVQVSDGVRNAPFVGFGIVDSLARDFRGNFVVIRHASNEYGFYAHLIPGSITVNAGQRITRGQVIGHCGNSGHSTEPHLHFHVQDHPNFFMGMGLPVQFDRVLVDAAPSGGGATGARFLQAGVCVQQVPE